MGANKALNTIFKHGYPYAKAGILLSQFSHPAFIQKSLFEATDQLRLKQDANLMQTIDELNSIHTQIYYASQCSEGYHPYKKNGIA